MHFSLLLVTFLKLIGINQNDENNSLEKSVYDGCGTNKFCVGFPHQCIERKSCKEFAATFKKGN
jgi:hypothetical protein